MTPIQKIKQKAFQKLESLSIDQVQELIILCFESNDPETDLPLDWALEYLEGLMPVNEFCQFCETLD